MVGRPPPPRPDRSSFTRDQNRGVPRRPRHAGDATGQDSLGRREAVGDTGVFERRRITRRAAGETNPRKARAAHEARLKAIEARKDRDSALVEVLLAAEGGGSGYDAIAPLNALDKILPHVVTMSDAEVASLAINVEKIVGNVHLSEAERVLLARFDEEIGKKLAGGEYEDLLHGGEVSVSTELPMSDTQMFMRPLKRADRPVAPDVVPVQMRPREGIKRNEHVVWTADNLPPVVDDNLKDLGVIKNFSQMADTLRELKPVMNQIPTAALGEGFRDVVRAGKRAERDIFDPTGELRDQAEEGVQVMTGVIDERLKIELHISESDFDLLDAEAQFALRYLFTADTPADLSRAEIIIGLETDEERFPVDAILDHIIDLDSATVLKLQDKIEEIRDNQSEGNHTRNERVLLALQFDSDGELTERSRRVLENNRIST